MVEYFFKRAKYLFFFVLFLLFYSNTKAAFATPKPQSTPMAASMPKPTGTSRKALKQYKSQISLKREQFETCIGLILGDASLQTQDDSKSYRLKFEVGEKNIEYLKHIQEVLEPFIISQPREVTRVNKAGNTVKTFQLNTISHPDFNVFAEGFLLNKGNKKKSIDYNFLYENLTARSIAYWFMDDGGKLDYTSNEGKGIVFHTQGFQLEEVQHLCKILHERFGYKTWVKKNKGKYIVAISGEDYEDLTKNVYPYIVPSMQQKWPKPRKS